MAEITSSQLLAVVQTFAPSPIGEDTVREWLSRQRAVLWGRSYDLFQESSREALVGDVLRLVGELQEIAEER